MFETATREELEMLERTVQRVFARVSMLEARVSELERELETAHAAAAHGVDRPYLVEALRRTA